MMTPLLKIGCFFCLVCVLMTFPVQKSLAQTSIAVVDVERLLRESKVAKSLQKQLKTKRENFQKEFSKHEQELRDAEKKLTQDRSTLSSEEFTKQHQAFEEKLLETRKLFQKRRSSLDQALGKATAKLRKEIAKIVADIADEKGYQVVFSRDDVVIVEKSLDISDDVMKLMNEKITEIKLEMK